MRNAALAGLALAILVAAVLYVRVARPESSVVVTPTPTATSTSSVSAPSSTSPASASPSASVSSALGAVTIQVTRTAVPAEFRYLVLGGGDEVRLVVLDLSAGSSTQVATARIAPVPGTAGGMLAKVATSADGRTVLLTFVLFDATDSVFVVRPENGDARLLLRAEVRDAVISSDGARVAIGRNDEDRSFTGLWVGAIADGAMRRLVADDPQSNASPPLPYAFSPDGAVLAFGLGLGEIGRRAMVVPLGSTEGRVDRSSGDPRIVGGEAVAVGPAAGAEFRSARELFVWSSRSLFGGETFAYVYDLATKRTTDLYRPTGDTLITAAAWRPSAEQYATIERHACCGAFAAGTAAWLRDRDGSARTLGDAAFVIEMWWSRDGSRLFARVGADDSVGRITDLLTGKEVMQFCLRGGGPSPAPCA